MVEELRRFRVLWSSQPGMGYDVIDAHKRGQPILKSFVNRGEAEEFANLWNEHYG